MTLAQSAPLLAEVAGVFLLGVVSPGQNFMFLTTQAARSRRAGLAVAVGFGLAALTWSALTALGLGALAARAPWAAVALRWLGAGYQLHVGLGMLLARGSLPTLTTASAALAGRHALGRGFAMSLLNPKAAAFYTGVLAQMLPHDAPAALDVAVAAILFAVAAGWYGGLALGFSTGVVQRAYMRVERHVRLASGVLIIALGARLALGL